MQDKGKKFQFDTVFETAQMVLTDLRYSQQQLDDFLLEHYQQGLEKGIQNTQQSIDAMSQQHLQQIHYHLTEVFAHQQELHATLAEQVSSVCRTITQQAFPVLSQRGEMDEILAVIEQVFADHVHGNIYKIHVGSLYRDVLEENLTTHFGHFADLNITVLADDNLEASECRVEWQTGGIERLMTHLNRQLETAFKRLNVEADYHKNKLNSADDYFFKAIERTENNDEELNPHDQQQVSS